MNAFLKNRKQNRIFISYFVPYLLFFLLAFIVVTAIFSITLINEYREHKQKSENILTTVAQTINKEMEIIFNSLSMIVESDEFLDVVVDDSFYANYKLQEQLELYSLTNDFVDKVYVSSKASPYITGAESIYLDNYPVFLYKDNDIFRDIYANYENFDSIIYTATSNGNEYLVVSRFYPTNPEDANNAGAIFFTIQPSVFLSILEHDFITSFTISQRSGSSIYSISTDSTEQEDSSYTATGNYLFNYTFGYNQSLAFADFNQLLFFYSVLLALLFLVLFLAAFSLAKIKVKPIEELARVCGIVESGNTKIESLVSYASKIISDDRKHNQLYLDNLPTLQATFFRRMIRGDVFEDGEIDRRVAFLKFPVVDTFCTVFIIKIEHSNNQPEVKQFLISMLYKYFGDAIYVDEHRCQDSVEVLINLSDNLDMQVLAQKNDELYQEMVNQHQTTIKVGIGDPCDGLSVLHLSHESAEECINSTTEDSCHVITGDTKKHGTNVYVYPEELKTALHNAVVNGTRDDISALFENIISLNDNISPQTNMYYLLLRDILSTFINILQSAKTSFNIEIDNTLENNITTMLYKIEQPNALEMLRSLFYTLNDNLRNVKTDKNMELKLKLIEFIDKNYTSNQFNLSMISQELGIPEYLISKKFKSFFGIKLSEYVEGLRMSCAERLINESDMSIECIAKKTGYSGAVSFRRAYKRHYNKLPRD